MRTLFTWLKEVERLGKVMEDDALWQVDIPEQALDQPEVVSLLSRADLLLTPKVQVRIETPRATASFVPAELDIELPDREIGCAEHATEFAALVKMQRESNLRPWTRVRFLRTLQACPKCNLKLTLQVEILKPKTIASLFEAAPEPCPEEVAFKLWFDPQRVAAQKPLEDYLHWDATPLVIGMHGPAPLQSDYVSCVELDGDAFPQRALAAATALAGRKKLLSGLIGDRPLSGSAARQIMPPEYWISQDSTGQEWFRAGLPVPGLFVIALLGQICQQVSREGDALVFRAEGAVPMVARCQLTRTGIRFTPNEYSLTPDLVVKLVHFYRETIQGKPQGQNLDLLQQAVRMSGQGDLVTILSKPERLEDYYKFLWNTLLKARFKEQNEVIKSYLAGVQAARAKVSGAIDELYKNLTAVVTGAAAVAAVLISAAVTKNQQIYDYLIISGLLLAFPYVPVHVLRARSLVAAAQNDLSQFEKDLRKSAEEVGFPFQVLDLKEQLEPSRKLVRRTIGETVLWLAVLTGISLIASVGAFSWGQPDLRSLVKVWVFYGITVAVAAFPVVMLYSFWNQRQQK